MTDRWNVRLVICFLGGFALLVASGAIFLANGNHTVPDNLWSLAGAAVGGLAGLLASTRSEPPPPPPPPAAVQVVNTPNQPVPVAPEPMPVPAANQPVVA